MAEIDHHQNYQDLVKILNKIGLKWVTQQVSETILAGKTIEDIQPRRMYPALKIEDYTDAEKILLLIDALEQVVVNTAEIEAEITTFLGNLQTEFNINPELIFYEADEIEENAFKFMPESGGSRLKPATQLQRLLDRCRGAIQDHRNYSALISQIIESLDGLITTQIQTESHLQNLFKFYTFIVVLKAAANEGAQIHYQNVLNETPKHLIFRNSSSKIHGSHHPYTHAVIEFPNKPALEVHLGVKLQGRSWVLHDCDLLILHEQEAYLCRTKKREPRPSRVILMAESKYYTSILKLDLARSFLGLVSDLRIRGDCYFITNTTSPAAAKLLTMARKKWEQNITPRATNDVNRLMYSFQTLFKDFKAR